MPPAKSPKKRTKKRKLVLLDTGPLVGLYNEKDDWHTRCKSFFGGEDSYDYLLTQAVIAEVVYHIQQDKHPEAASRVVVSFLADIEDGIFEVHEFTSNYISRIKKLRSQYPDQKVDFADLSLVVAAEERQIGEIVTIDLKDFGFLKFEFGSKKRKVAKAFSLIVPGAEK